MTSLQDIINLAHADGGKFFVMDGKGDVKLVIMPVAEYEKVLLGKLQKQTDDLERINKEIMDAQLREEPAPAEQPQTPRNERPSQAVIKQRLEDALPIQIPFVQSKNDLREEVIDPSFDFEGPKVEIDDL